jgi:anaerobic magnesium-protoporphyrin IX monomethyl ester cyclase
MRADVTAKNPELIKKGAQAGMSVAFLGIESGSPEILKKMHKGILTSSAVVAVRTLSQNGIIVLGGMMLGAPYESLSEMITTVRFAHKLADVGLDAVQFSLYTPLPGTRIFDDAIRYGQLFTLDWDRYDLLTPVMRTKVHPVITQIIQAYGNYSFYVLKYIKGKLLRRKEIVHKEKLVKNATKFIFDMMPEYLRDILAFPGVLLRTAREYKRRTVLTKERVHEILQLSNTIIYEEVGGKNPYFMIKES